MGPDKQYQRVAAAVAAAQDGDTVQVDAGTYTNDFPVVNARITVEGVGGLATLVATVPTEKAILITNTSATLRHLEFTGAANVDVNGAGIRYQGGDLVVEDSYFHDNQDGILAGADPNGTIRITRSEFARGGNDAGSAHNLYIGDVQRFVFDHSYSHDAHQGHELKSRAENTVITDSRLFDLQGDASYSINIPNGGNLTITGSVIEQGANSPNGRMITYGEEGALRAGTSVTISGNTLVNHLSAHSPVGLWDASGVPMTVTGNTLWGLSLDQFAGGTPGALSGNVVTGVEPTLDTSHPFAP